MIFRGLWKRPCGEEQAVAVKAFRGAMLADGSPLDELRAWSAAGSQANLTPLLGRLAGHALHKDALVFKLLSAK